MTEPKTCCEACRKARNVPCPTCGAERGQPCTSEIAHGVSVEKAITHLTRRIAYGRATS